jgi:hypothetical protein
MSLRETIVQGVSDNLRTIGAAVLGYVALVEGGYVGGYPSVPSVPEEARLFATAAVIVAIVGFVGESQLRSLLADEETPGDRLHVVNAMREDRLAVYELPDEGPKSLAELEVVGGPLNHLPESLGNAYEVLAYDEERHVAVSTWRMSEPASSFVGQETVSDVLVEIEDLRTRLEPRARAGQVIQQSLPGVVRELHYQVVTDINDLLRGDVQGDFGTVDVGRVIDERVPEVGQPARLAYDRAETLQRTEEGAEAEPDATAAALDTLAETESEITVTPTGGEEDSGGQ